MTNRVSELRALKREDIKKLTVNQMCELCHSIALEKGFWDEKRNMGEALMLIVTELAEAMEAYRVQDQENFREELQGRGYTVEQIAMYTHQYHVRVPHCSHTHRVKINSS